MPADANLRVALRLAAQAIAALANGDPAEVEHPAQQPNPPDARAHIAVTTKRDILSGRVRP
jgi:hypothetical protein